MSLTSNLRAPCLLARRAGLLAARQAGPDGSAPSGYAAPLPRVPTQAARLFSPQRKIEQAPSTRASPVASGLGGVHPLTGPRQAVSSLIAAARPRLGSQPPSSFPDFAFLEGRKAPMQMLPVPSMPSALRPPRPQASGHAAPLKFDPQALNLNAQTSSGPQQAPQVPQAAAQSHQAHAGVAPRAPPAPPLPPAFAPPAHASHPASARGEPASGQVGRVTVPAGHPARTSTSGGAGLSGLSPGTAASSSASALGRPTGTKAKRQVTIVGTDAESQETMRRFLAVSLRHYGGTMISSRRKPNAGKLAGHHDDLGFAGYRARVALSHSSPHFIRLGSSYQAFPCPTATNQSRCWSMQGMNKRV